MRKIYKARSIGKIILEYFKPLLRLRHYILWLIIDPFDFLFKRRDNFTPAYRLRVKVGPFASAVKYRSVGQEFLGYLKGPGNLKPDDRILDVGCGCGQMASALTGYLDKRGSYEGFDIEGTLIEWCWRNISSRYPNFRFIKSNVYNKIFNPKGKFPASSYRFPYDDESFDFVLVKSVFMHMLPADMEKYLSEVFRVLKGGGKCLVSYFLLNQESLDLIESGASSLDFRYNFVGCRIKDRNTPERAVAYEEYSTREWYKRSGFKIEEPVYYGSWCARPKFFSYQDIIFAGKA